MSGFQGPCAQCTELAWGEGTLSLVTFPNWPPAPDGCESQISGPSSSNLHQGPHPDSIEPSLFSIWDLCRVRKARIAHAQMLCNQHFTLGSKKPRNLGAPSQDCLPARNSSGPPGVALAVSECRCAYRSWLRSAPRVALH